MILKQIKEYYEDNLLKTLLILLLIISIFNIINIPDIGMSFENKILYFFSTRFYQLSIIIILFIFSIKIINLIDSNLFIVLRYNSKKEYINSIIKIIVLNNIFIYTLSVLISLILLTIFNYNNISFINYEIYNIPFFIYNIYTLIKYYFIIDSIVIIGILLFKGQNIYISSFFLFFILIFKDNWNYNIDIINSLKDFKLFYGYYLMILKYSSFSLELCALSLELIILSSIKELINKLILIKRIGVGE